LGGSPASRHTFARVSAISVSAFWTLSRDVNALADTSDWIGYALLHFGVEFRNVQYAYFHDLLGAILVRHLLAAYVPSAAGEDRLDASCDCTARGFWDTGLNPTPPLRWAEAVSDGIALG
jgi:hypothetical protein